MKTILIPAVCSMKGCEDPHPPIAAMSVQLTINGKLQTVWASMCLKHSKGHGKIDTTKVRALFIGYVAR